MSFAERPFKSLYYKKTALTTVVCQLGFNPILRIAQEVPVRFQDAIRSVFPKYFREHAFKFQFMLGGEAPPSIPMPETFPSTPTVSRFKTEDGEWTAGLGVDFLSLETTAYAHFEDFQKRFVVLHDALRAAYGVEAYVRVGFRYINSFQLSDFGENWRAMFNPHLLGPLADQEIGTSVAQAQQLFVLSDEDWTITVRHGTANGSYVLDLDHATAAHVTANDLMARLASFNRRMYQVFRWSIADALHTSMEPIQRE